MAAWLVACLFLPAIFATQDDELISPNMELIPEELGPVTEGTLTSFQLRLLNASNDGWQRVYVEVSTDTFEYVSIESANTIEFTEGEIYNGTNKFVEIKVLEMGHGVITVKATGWINGTKSIPTYQYLKVKVIRQERVIDKIFLTGIAIFVIINNMNMGCLLDLNIVKEVFRKPIGPAVGFCSQFLFMPLASYGFSFAFLSESNLRLGLFALGCCPGGAVSNFWTVLLRGDVNLSVVMTFISTVAALGMMPLWLFTLGKDFLSDIHVPYENLIYSLIAFVAPVGVGVFVRYWRPNWAKWAEKIVRPYTIILLIFFMTIGIYSTLPILRLITWKVILAGICVAWGGYLFGALSAWALRMGKEQIIAISIETALQNPGIAFVLLKISLPPPDDDIAAVSPIAQLFVTGLPLWVAFIVCCIYQRRQLPSEDTIFDVKAFKGLFSKNNSIPSSKGNPVLDPSQKLNSNLWISVALHEEEDEDVKMIRSFGDGETEDVVWQKQ